MAEMWDGKQLNITFHRYFDHGLLIKWYELPQIAQSIQITEDEDAII